MEKGDPLDACATTAARGAGARRSRRAWLVMLLEKNGDLLGWAKLWPEPSLPSDALTLPSRADRFQMGRYPSIPR